jgi:mRNA-degrading endonuclease toxin of MazEF toxin-antitoxin module
MIDKGDIYQADLDPTKDSEPAGCRPVVMSEVRSN